MRYATNAGDTASIAFTGRRIEWYGPVGPTRGEARIIIDGVAQKPIKLTRSSFRPRTLLYSHSWKTAGRHTLVVEVLATRGHKLVAIDELVVTPSSTCPAPSVPRTVAPAADNDPPGRARQRASTRCRRT